MLAVEAEQLMLQELVVRVALVLVDREETDHPPRPQVAMEQMVVEVVAAVLVVHLPLGQHLQEATAATA
jgi:hypothetical protein